MDINTKKRNRIPSSDHLLIITDYLTCYRQIKDIASHYGVTRQCIHKILSKHGVNGGAARYRQSVCENCGATFRHRRKASVGKYCSPACYFEAIARGNGKPYIDDPHKRREARAIVSKKFKLRPGNVVHHIDRDSTNNRIDNLMVFGGQGDHVRYHRTGNARPIWDGREVAQCHSGNPN